MSDELPQPEGLSFQNHIKKVASTGRPNSIAIIGTFKAGKTTLAASAVEIPALKASGKEVLILESETGTASIADDYPDVNLFSITTAGGFNRAVNELLTRPHNYGVVIFDTMDKFQEYVIASEVDGASDTRAGWAIVKRWVTETTWRLHKSGMLAIFLYHEDDVKNERSGEVKTSFKLQGNAKKDLGQIFDIIARLDVRRGEDGEYHRYLQLGPAEGQITGSRYERKLPNVMIDPTMAKIFELLEGPNKSATPTTPTENKE